MILFKDMINDTLYFQGVFDLAAIYVNDFRKNLDIHVIDLILSGIQVPIDMEGVEVGRIAQYRIIGDDMKLILALLKDERSLFDKWLLSIGMNPEDIIQSPLLLEEINGSDSDKSIINI
jgi:hypothetical protein